MQEFQSTPPVKAATIKMIYLDENGNISIHAAREGGDNAGVRLPRQKSNFNPRRP